MDQRRSALVKHIIKCFSCLPNLCPQPKSSLINHLISDDLGCWMLDRHSDVATVASTHQYLA